MMPFLITGMNGYAVLGPMRIVAYRRRSLVLVAAIGLIQIMALQF
jgi:hypothetical protein